MEELTTVFGIDGKMIIAQMVNFGVLLAALTYFLYRPMIAFLDKRRDEIIETVKKSEAAEKTLADAALLREEVVTMAAKEAAEIVTNAKTNASHQAATIVTEAEERAKRAAADALLAAEEIKRKVLAESRAEIAELIVLGAEKVLTEKKVSSV